MTTGIIQFSNSSFTFLGLLIGNQVYVAFGFQAACDFVGMTMVMVGVAYQLTYNSCWN